MKRFFLRIITAVLCLSFFTSLTTTASAGLFTGVAKGQLQDTSAEGNGIIYWEFSYNLLTNSASLKLSGEGYMPNDTEDSWHYVQLDKRCYITQLEIGNGIKSIMEYAFSGEQFLESVVLPDSLEYIGDYAFANTGLTSVTLPKKLEALNGTAFTSATLKDYKVHPENPYFTAVDGVVYSKDMTKLVAYPPGKQPQGLDSTFVMPKSVKEIGAYAFVNCLHTSFTIPGTVKNVGANAFAGNIELSKLNIENGVKGFYDGAFLSCAKLEKIHLPVSVNYIGFCTFGFVYELDTEALTFMLDQKGINHDPVTESNAEYYALLSGYSIDAFISCVVSDKVKIYAPSNSAGHKYCQMFDVPFVASAAVTPELISAKQTVDGVNVKWTYSTDADGYYVLRKNKSGKFEQIANIKNKSLTEYKDKKAISSSDNTYTVKAYNKNGSSAYDKKGVTAYYVKAPELKSAKNSSKGIKVTWSKVSTATKYEIYKRKKGESMWLLQATVDKTKSSYTDTNVISGLTCYYTVCAVDNKSKSEFYDKGVGARYVPAPKISNVKNTSKGVSISWKKVSGATSYRVYRKTSKSDWVLLKKLNASTFSFTDATAKSGVKYSYSVRAVDKPTVSGYNSKTIEYLKKPVISTAQSTKKGITLKFSKSTGAKKYYIYRKLDGEKDWNRNAVVNGVSNTSYLDTTAVKGKVYRYSVRACDGSYKSAYDTKGYKIKDKY